MCKHPRISSLSSLGWTVTKKWESVLIPFQSIRSLRLRNPKDPTSLSYSVFVLFVFFHFFVRAFPLTHSYLGTVTFWFFFSNLSLFLLWVSHYRHFFCSLFTCTLMEDFVFSLFFCWFYITTYLPICQHIFTFFILFLHFVLSIRILSDNYVAISFLKTYFK